MSEYLHVEKPFLDQLGALGWTVIDQGQGFIPTDPAASLRAGFGEWILPEVFRDAVQPGRDAALDDPGNRPRAAVGRGIPNAPRHQCVREPRELSQGQHIADERLIPRYPPWEPHRPHARIIEAREGIPSQRAGLR